MFALSKIIPTFVPDMKKLIYIIGLMLLATACSKNGIVEKLNEVDSLVAHEQYDSANVIMSQIDTTLLTDAENKAHYYLLHTQLTYVGGKVDSINILDNIVLPFYSKSENKEKTAEAYYYKAYSAILQKDYSLATTYYKQAEALASQTLNLRLHYKVAEGLAYVNARNGKHLLRLDYGWKCAKISKTINNKGWLAYSYLNIAMAHFNLNHKDSFELYINKAAQLRNYIADKDKYSFLANLAYTYKKSQPEKAKRYFHEALIMKDNSVIMEHLADIYYKEGNEDKAYHLWKRALAVNDNNPKDNIIHNLLEYDVEHGKTDNVCKQVNEIISIKDSIINVLKNDTIKDLQLRFDHEVAMRKQEQVTSNWQKGLLATILLVTLLVAYIIINRYREKNKLQEAQLQISNLVNQIREREAAGENDSEMIRKLNKQFKDMMNKEGSKLKKGKMLYDDILNGKKVSLWKKKDFELFINYYTAIDFKTVNRLKNTKRKEILTPQKLFFLILKEMGYEKDEIARILGIKTTSVNTLNTRTKPIE